MPRPPYGAFRFGSLSDHLQLRSYPKAHFDEAKERYINDVFFCMKGTSGDLWGIPERYSNQVGIANRFEETPRTDSDTLSNQSRY
eukprot:jgi/Botrbrau1/6130/Bobra.331_2s0025.1